LHHSFIHSVSANSGHVIRTSVSANNHFLLRTTSSSNITVRRKQSGIPKLHVPPEHVQNLTQASCGRRTKRV